MTLHLMMTSGFTAVIENITYFSIYPHENEGRGPCIRIEYKNMSVEYIELKDVNNIWSRVS